MSDLARKSWRKKIHLLTFPICCVPLRASSSIGAGYTEWFGSRRHHMGSRTVFRTLEYHVRDNSNQRNFLPGYFIQPSPLASIGALQQLLQSRKWLFRPLNDPRCLQRRLILRIYTLRNQSIRLLR